MSFNTGWCVVFAVAQPVAYKHLIQCVCFFVVKKWIFMLTSELLPLMLTFAGIPGSQPRGQGHDTVSASARWKGGAMRAQPDGQTTQDMYVLHTSAAFATVKAPLSENTKCKFCMADIHSLFVFCFSCPLRRFPSCFWWRLQTDLFLLCQQVTHNMLTHLHTYAYAH